MKKMKIVLMTFALVLSGFGLVGTASAGLTAPVFLECGAKFKACCGDDEWEVIYMCGSLWQDAGTEVNCPELMGFLTADEIDGFGTCDSMMAISEKSATRSYGLDCSLPSNAGGGGKDVKLKVKVGLNVCDP